MDVDGLRLHVRGVGAPDAPPLVLLHGIMGHAREWDPVVDALAGAWRVLAIDQRGHGRSDHADDYAVEPMAADVLGVLDAVGVRSAAVVGHSMGGMVGLVLAADHPDRVSRLALLDIAPDSVTPEAAAGLADWMATLARTSYDSTAEALAEWMAGDPYATEVHMRRYVEHCLRRRPDGRLVWRFDGARLGRFVTDGVRSEQLWDAAERLSLPLVLVRGEHSPFVPIEAAEAVAARTGGRVVTIADAAHDLGVQQPEAVATALLDEWAPPGA